MAGLVICDASPIIGLARVDGLDWLTPMFGQVWIPGQVESEVLSDRARQDQAVIRAAVGRGILNVWPNPIEPVIAADLDEGESACIDLALAHPGSLVLIDDRAGRTMAREHGIAVAGTAAVIGQARTRGLIPSARDIFERLLQGDFRIAPEVILTVLRQVGEACD